MTQLKNMIKNTQIVENLKRILLDEICQELLKAINNCDENELEITITKGDEKYNIVAAAYKSKGKTIEYLLEVRLFDNEGDMTETYLECFNHDLSINPTYIYDVWSYTEWEKL